MPHTHHCHSGSYCAHADPSSTLSAMFQRALDANMTVFAMTEHMPRGDADLYPEEIEAKYDAATLQRKFDEFVAEAVELRERYYATGSIEQRAVEGHDQALMSTPTSASHSISQSRHPTATTTILIGFEAEYIHPLTAPTQISSLLTTYSLHLDFFLGSVHHVHTIPIDFDAATYLRAIRACDPPTPRQLTLDYFTAQHSMLLSLRPPIVAHFDLIRLLSETPDADWRADAEVWGAIVRNLEEVRRYGGVLEVNTSAWRKGLEEPYPRGEVVRKWREMGGEVVLGDDAHAVGQVGTCYGRLRGWLGGVGVRRVAFVKGRGGKRGADEEVGKGSRDWRERGVELGFVDVDDLEWW